MRTKKTIRIISCLLVAILLSLGIAGCTTSRLGTSPKKLIYDPMLPEGVTATLKEWEDQIRYTYQLQFEDGTVGAIYLHTKSSYAYEYVLKYRNCYYEEVTTQQLGDTGKRVLYYSFEGDSTKYAKIRGTLHRGEEIIIMEKYYTLAKGQTEIDETADIPIQVAMYCRQGDTYYIVNISGFTEAKSDEWLLSFGLDLSSETD